MGTVRDWGNIDYSVVKLIKHFVRRFGPTHIVDPAEDFTRLTFDTIALTAMSYRFNAFYSVSFVFFFCPDDCIDVLTSYI